MNRRALLAVLAVATIACGKRGDPKPPVPVIPQASSDLAVTQRADRVVLSWSYPAMTTAGRPLAAFRRITVYRYVESLSVVPGGRDPGSILPGDIDPTVPQAIALFTKIPTIPRSQFLKLANKVDSIEKEALTSATTGAKLIFSDAPAFTSADGRPVRITYSVVTEGEQAKSEFSNLAVIVPLPVAAPPADLAAEAKPEGVQLRWSAPSTSVGGSEVPMITGYHVYRTGPGEELTELSVPITTAPVKETSFTDTPPYGEHDYRVVAVTWTGPPLLQSAASAAAHVAFRDLLPPPAPGNLTTLIESNNIRLLWDAVDAPDLAGYKVYRYEGVGHVDIKEAGGFAMTPQPIQETTYVDRNVDLGIAFRYEVSAVDKSGNESPRTQTGWVVAPKTP